MTLPFIPLAQATRRENATPHGRPTSTSQTTLTSFFRSLPASNPFTTQPAPPWPLAPAVPATASPATASPATASPATASLVGSHGRNNDDDGDSDEEVSVYSFTSEYSEHSVDADADEQQEVSALEYMVEKLYQQFQDGFHGCSVEQHDEQLCRHMSETRGQHYGLGQLFHDPNFPSVLSIPGFITAERLARQPNPTVAQWEAMFCGIPPQQQDCEQEQEHLPPRYPIRLCLHAEQTQAVEPQVAFDIDSFLGFASSLAMARQGLWYQPVPLAKQNMETDVHIRSHMAHASNNPEQPTRLASAMLKDIPHFILGRVVGASDISVYILFPYLAMVGSGSNLTKEQLSRWLDKIFLPAIHQNYEAHYTQHLPAGYHHALANSKAHQVEGRRVKTDSYCGQRSITYHLQPEVLDEVWTAIQDKIATTPGLGDFREPQLFFSAKGTKLQFKTNPSRPTLLDAMENFASYLYNYVDLDFVYTDRLYIDIGKEICPRVSLLRQQQQHVDDEAQVYAWKRCCLKSNLRWMYDGEPPSDGGAGQRLYYQNLLYDACSLTSLAPRRSKQCGGGLIYSQYYNSVKEVSDIHQRYPFDHDGMEELALDPQIRQGARHIAGGRGSDIKVLEAAYCASKNRTQQGLSLSQKKSFGIREEHRISWLLFEGLIDRLRWEVDSGNDLAVVLDDCPSYAWAVKTDTYLQFLWRSVDKFATGFEVVRARCSPDLVTWEQTKMMAMFLRCLRSVLASHQPNREGALWWSRRERSLGVEEREEGVAGLRVWYGLGFCNTLPRYGYCWLEPRIDWARLVFKSDVTDNVLFGNGILRKQYLRHGGRVRDFFATTRRLELAMDWLNKHHNNNAIRRRILAWILHLCLQQLRIDVLTSLASEIRPEYREEALQGLEPFCFDYLDEIMIGSVHLVSGNRSRFKDVTDLGRFLFNYDDGHTRDHWEDRPFRKLYRRAYTMLSIVPGNRRLHEMLMQWLVYMLCWYHWVLPYPCAYGLMQTTKQSQHMWYSIRQRNDPDSPAATADPTKAVWEWAGKSYEPGQPEELPSFVSWGKEEWEEWIEDEVRREEGRRRAAVAAAAAAEGGEGSSVTL
jgi:hypothetical protein